MLQDYFKRIMAAPVYDVAIESPLDQALSLSRRLGASVWLKREDLQPVFSFKLRGAYAKMRALDDPARERGVIAASAGNHAQGVALAAQKMGIKATIVMPVTSPEIKIKGVQNLGAEVVLSGDTYDEAYLHARKLARHMKLTFIHPYDDPDVIAGQGTVAKEILTQHPEPLDAIFVPVGGGGLIAGIAAYVKFVRPEVKVIGVEPYEDDSLYQALKAKRLVRLKQVGIFADGVAVAQTGKEPFRIARKCVDQVVRVTTDEICAAIKDIFSETRTVAEPAGALGVAGIKRYLADHPKAKGGNYVAVVSGANITFERLRHVAERTAVGEKREILLAVELPERPGALLQFCKLLGKRGITEFNYRYFSDSEAHIFVGVQVPDYETEGKALIRKLNGHGFKAKDLTGNELAKEHVRYMVGGRPPKLIDEILYRFEFPERPGALMQFLTSMNPKWNISLFHYRNHAAASGRVLMGIQVPKKQRAAFDRFVRRLDFGAVDETANPAYRIFLKN